MPWCRTRDEQGRSLTVHQYLHKPHSRDFTIFILVRKIGPYRVIKRMFTQGDVKKSLTDCSRLNSQTRPGTESPSSAPRLRKSLDGQTPSTSKGEIESEGLVPSTSFQLFSCRFVPLGGAISRCWSTHTHTSRHPGWTRPRPPTLLPDSHERFNSSATSPLLNF